ncbi:MAG: Crp/Fnr family transcriptional regulator [Deltaproteobacteria bacterium]|nr:Crp/Fnr family transcriptional regulator [Deltaproteobacteria bacterium]
MRRISCQQCTVRAHTYIADLPVEELGDFQTCTVTGLYKPRQVVFHEGTPAGGLYVLCHGNVKLYQSDRFGREFILDIATPGTILGELGLADEDTYSASAEALTEAQLSFLPRERLVKFLERHPKTSMQLIATLSRALAATRRKAGELALKRADARLADLLLRLGDGACDDADANDGAPRLIRLTYSRRELADMIGVSTETAIRLLAKLKRNRMIAIEDEGIVVLDLERLTRLAHYGNLTA